MNPLEPCPFCGGLDLRFIGGFASNDPVQVECLTCLARGPNTTSRYDEEKATERWNRRAGTPTDPAPPPELVPRKLEEN